MSKDETFSEDELDDVQDDMVVPMTMVQEPTPQVLTGPYASGGADPESRSNAYNERLSRARTALTQQRSAKFANNGGSLTNQRLPWRIDPFGQVLATRL